MRIFRNASADDHALVGNTTLESLFVVAVAAEVLADVGVPAPCGSPQPVLPGTIDDSAPRPRWSPIDWLTPHGAGGCAPFGLPSPSRLYAREPRPAPATRLSFATTSPCRGPLTIQPAAAMVADPCGQRGQDLGGPHARERSHLCRHEPGGRGSRLVPAGPFDTDRLVDQLTGALEVAARYCFRNQHGVGLQRGCDRVRELRFAPKPSSSPSFGRTLMRPSSTCRRPPSPSPHPSDASSRWGCTAPLRVSWRCHRVPPGRGGSLPIR